MKFISLLALGLVAIVAAGCAGLSTPQAHEDEAQLAADLATLDEDLVVVAQRVCADVVANTPEIAGFVAMAQTNPLGALAAAPALAVKMAPLGAQAAADARMLHADVKAVVADMKALGRDARSRPTSTAAASAPAK